MYAFMSPLPRDADQPDAEPAYDMENDYKGTGVETVVVWNKNKKKLNTVCAHDPSE